MRRDILLITGASSGIGLATAIAAAKSGFTVIATVRSPERELELRAAAEQAHVELDIQTLEVTSPSSVDACFDYIRRSYGQLDALVNNAGSGHLGTVELEALEDVRAVMEVNFFGVVAMTHAAMPLLRASGGRVLTVSSVGGVVGQPFNEAYCAAKFAVEGFMESLTPVASAVGVHVTVVEPGAVATKFVAAVHAQDQPKVAGTPYEKAFEAYLQRTRSAFSPESAQTAESVSAVIVDALLSPEPAARVQTSDTSRRFAGIKVADLDGARVQDMTRTWVTTT